MRPRNTPRLASALLLAALSLSTACGAPRPQGRSGPEADALARAVEAAVDIPAWRATGAVRWTFMNRHEHLWDRHRDLIRVRYGDTEIMRALWEPRGRAWISGKEVTDPDDLQELLDEAYAKWVNDAFWLNPLEKLFDPGVRREVVTTEAGTDGLLVTFGSGGLTPGDAYLWTLDENGRPTHWKMWVSILPIGGVGASWEGWVRLPTGAWVSTRHATPVWTLELGNVAGARDVVALLGEDPFERLPPSPDHPEPAH